MKAGRQAASDAARRKAERNPRFALVVFVTCLFALLFSPPGTRAASDFQTWQWLTVRLWKTNDFRLTLCGDNRMAEDSSRQKLFILGPRVAQRVHPNLNLGAGYLFLDIQDLGARTWRHEHRLDFAVSPSVDLTKKSELHLRNRIELRWLERSVGAIPRSRHRLQLKHRVEWGPINSVYCNNEFLIDHRLGRYSENRLVPAGVGIRLHKRVSVELFYMIQSTRRASGKWDDNHIFGTHLKLRLDGG